MTFNPDERERRSTRLPAYDYSQPGAYFVTICTHQRKCIFADIADGEMHLNNLGCVVAQEWTRSADIRREIELDEWIIMPNHIHGIVFIRGDGWERSPASSMNVGAHGRAPLHRMPRSLASFVAGFKAAAAKRINLLRRSPGRPLWQRNYYEHIIRNREDLHEVQQYILDNPLRWAMDNENPDAGAPLTARAP